MNFSQIWNWLKKILVIIGGAAHVTPSLGFNLIAALSAVPLIGGFTGVIQFVAGALILWYGIKMAKLA